MDGRDSGRERGQTVGLSGHRRAVLGGRRVIVPRALGIATATPPGPVAQRVGSDAIVPIG